MPGSQTEWSLWSSWVEVPGEADWDNESWFPQAPDNSSFVFPIEVAGPKFNTMAHARLLPHYSSRILWPLSISVFIAQQEVRTRIPACVRPRGKWPPSFLVFKFPAASVHKASAVLSWVCCFSLCKLLEHQLLPPFSDYI